MIKIRKLFQSIFCMLALCFVCCQSTFAQNNIRENADRLKTALGSQDVNVRLDAYVEIRRWRELAVEHFGGELEDDRFWNDVNATGIATAGLYTIQKLRINEIVPQLVKHIDWSIDTKTYKAGARRNNNAQYAVSLALISIAGPDVKKYVVKRLRVTTDTKQRLFCLWVLNRTEGESLPFILDKEIERNVFDDEKANLAAAKAALPTLEATWNNFLFTGALELPKPAP